ncbi:MAG: NfeD family protein [Planctomycetota bacterium]
MRYFAAIVAVLMFALPARAEKAVAILLDGDVDAYMYTMLERRLDEARDLGAERIILRIDTFGGAVDAGLRIGRTLKQLEIPVTAYVDEKAISAGAMIALACDEIVMEPGSFLGDSGVITMGGEMGEVERAKAESLVLAEFVDSAEEHGYDRKLVRSFVVVDHVIYYIENPETGERRFVDAEEHAELVEADDAVWVEVADVEQPVDGEKTLLTVNASTAEKIGLSQGTFATPEALAEARGYEIIATLQPSGGDRLIAFLSGFAARGILSTVFLLSLYIAFQSPGTGVPETIAAGSLFVLLGVPFLTGHAQWYEILAVVIGVGLILVELFVIPGFGVAGITGAGLMLGGLLMTFLPDIRIPIPGTGDDGTAPSYAFDVDWAGLRYGFATVLGSMVVSLLLWWWISKFLPSMPYANKLILNDVAGGTEPAEPTRDNFVAAAPVADVLPLGTVGEAVSDLYPGGQARFNDQVLDVISDRGFVESGDRVVVREVHGNRVVVRKV